MNFLSFSPTKKSQTSCKTVQPLFYLLFCRSSALQLAPLQRKFDQILPLYIGKADKPFNPVKTGAIIFQVTNRERPSSVDAITGEPFFSVKEYEGARRRQMPERFAKPTPETLLRTAPAGPKYLFMLLDPKICNGSVKSSRIKESQPSFWAIHIMWPWSKNFSMLGGFETCVQKVLRQTIFDPSRERYRLYA